MANATPKILIALIAATMTACGSGSKEVSDRYRPLHLEQAPELRVNGYLWQAAIETLSFMPLDSTDATGGVTVTDWYSHPSSPSERTKVQVSILDARLRADALRVVVNRQQQSSDGWIDAPVQQATVAGLEDAILVRARQIRIRTVAEDD